MKPIATLDELAEAVRDALEQGYADGIRLQRPMETPDLVQEFLSVFDTRTSERQLIATAYNVGYESGRMVPA